MLSPFLGIVVAIAILFRPGMASDPLPPLTVPYCFGVQIHFLANDTMQLNLIAKAGLKIIRMDYYNTSAPNPRRDLCLMGRVKI